MGAEDRKSPEVSCDPLRPTMCRATLLRSFLEELNARHALHTALLRLAWRGKPRRHGDWGHKSARARTRGGKLVGHGPAAQEDAAADGAASARRVSGTACYYQ
jgi:hypothetical protein